MYCTDGAKRLDVFLSRAKRTLQCEAVITHEVRITSACGTHSSKNNKSSPVGLLLLLRKGYKKDIFGVLLTGFEPLLLLIILFLREFRPCEL